MVIPEERMVVAINTAWPAADPPELWQAQSESVEELRAALRGGGD
ncbi:MAG: hypothetical protein WCY15_15110 [Phenylobacterium sp.]|nr:hypothetical protein [Phenylobacterium sp.]MDX9999222.1 hypothetical protein [Phenylobacterium sp.]